MASFFDFQDELAESRRQARAKPEAIGEPLTVSQLTARIDGVIRGGFPAPVLVKGEVSNFKSHNSGHAYFTLKDALAVSDVSITTSDQKKAAAADIRIAPYDMDLAVIYVDGIYGKAASLNYSDVPFKGEDVVALGEQPVGLRTIESIEHAPQLGAGFFLRQIGWKIAQQILRQVELAALPLHAGEAGQLAQIRRLDRDRETVEQGIVSKALGINQASSAGIEAKSRLFCPYSCQAGSIRCGTAGQLNKPQLRGLVNHFSGFRRWWRG